MAGFEAGFSSVIDGSKAEWESVIRASHERSLKYGISPAQQAAPEATRLSPGALSRLLRKRAPVLNVVSAQLALVRDILEDSSFCTAIADPDGYVLQVLGEGPVKQQYIARKCLPGYRWLERDIGTCAFGLVLHTGKPVLLEGRQMFSTAARHITNSAAPVFDHKGDLVCVIGLSGLADKVHLHTLGMLLQAAESIRLQLREQERARELDLYARHMEALVESDHRGIVTLDRKGHIVHCNKKAKALLGLAEESRGADIDRYVASKISVSSYVRKGRGFTDREMLFASGGKEQAHVASLDPLVQRNAVAGGLFTVMEQRRAMRLANAISGDQAAFTFESILGKSPAIRRTVQMADAAARSNAPVLIQGETGTGKELFAQAIHNASSRARAPFVVINCGAIPKELLESELFGYEEGAFTGAQKGGRPGKLELAHGGTVFLDEIGDIPFDMQAKLLRTLQFGEIQRIGSGHNLKLDLRVITATNVDLKRAIASNRFREDLYYRISTIALDIPPLRERGQDVITLAEIFLERSCLSLGKPRYAFTPEAGEAMLAYAWPGNVRQLENRVERAVVLSPGPDITPEHLGLADEAGRTPAHGGNGARPATLRETEREHIRELMRQYPHISGLARVLGVSRPTLYKKLKEYGLRPEA